MIRRYIHVLCVRFKSLWFHHPVFLLRNQLYFIVSLQYLKKWFCVPNYEQHMQKVSAVPKNPQNSELSVQRRNWMASLAFSSCLLNVTSIIKAGTILQNLTIIISPFVVTWKEQNSCKLVSRSTVKAEFLSISNLLESAPSAIQRAQTFCQGEQIQLLNPIQQRSGPFQMNWFGVGEKFKQFWFLIVEHLFEKPQHVFIRSLNSTKPPKWTMKPTITSKSINNIACGNRLRPLCSYMRRFTD